jgi:hypothetical protein
MDYFNSTTNLKEFKEKILTAEIIESDAVKFIEHISATPMPNDAEKKLAYFEIWYLLSLTNHSALVTALLPTVPAKIVFSAENTISAENITSQEDVKEEIPTPINIESAAKIECKNCDANETETCSEELAERLIAKWSPFDAKRYPELKRPEPGEFGNVFFDDNDIIPGKVITANVRIDHEGNIIEFLSGPTEVITCNDYEEIYAGLVGQIFDVEGLNA